MARRPLRSTQRPVLGHERQRDAMVVQVDLWSASGAAPGNLDNVLEREKDIGHATRRGTAS